IEQYGSPEEVYEEPRSEFVARFLGGSNILHGKAIDATHVDFGGAPIECHGAPLAAGTHAAVSIRQHHVALSNGASPPASKNAVQATVMRNVFLGSTRDYVVEAKGGSQLRITAAPEQSFAPGSSVWVTLPKERCRALVS
ncbi:MAG: TOBE domain-containing protein, partial [Myxococcales bacterium]